MTTPAVVLVEREDAVAIVTLDNAPVGALSLRLVAELDAAVDHLAADPPGAIVIRSAVDGFFGCGADLKLLAGIDAAGFADYLVRVRAPLDRLAAMDVLSIAAIDGLALGGGLELALACTRRIATPRSRVGLPEVTLGLLPGAGGTQRLPRLAGREVALDLMLSGRQVAADEALALGIVGEVVDGSVDERALTLAREHAARPSAATAAISRCVDAALPLSDPAGMALEAQEIAGLFATADTRDRIQTFVRKRSGGR